MGSGDTTSFFGDSSESGLICCCQDESVRRIRLRGVGLVLGFESHWSASSTLGLECIELCSVGTAGCVHPLNST